MAQSINVTIAERTFPLKVNSPEHEELIDTSYLQLRFALENSKVSYIGSLVITLVTTMFDYLKENINISEYQKTKIFDLLKTVSSEK